MFDNTLFQSGDAQVSHMFIDNLLSKNKNKNKQDSGNESQKSK